MWTTISRTIGRLWCGLFLVSCVLSMPLAPAAADDSTPPDVARISAIEGGVTMQRGDSGDAVDATVNAPVNVGDYITTAADARAEVQFDNADFVRIADNSQLRFTQLDSNANALQLASGAVQVALLRYTDARPQVETPSIKVVPDEAGEYRIVVDADGNTWVTVRSGSADLVAPDGTQTISAKTSVEISGDASSPDIRAVDYVAMDDFDTWNAQRDQYANAAFSSPAASTDITGLDDLSTYGNWQNVPGDGEAWVPNNQTADWAPYQDGRWAWEPYYGWTWVGYEPWGWAPYHYGRWVYAGNVGWAWCPGPANVRPAYQPALVAFFGFNIGGVNVGLSFGNAFSNVGWVPLAPGEPYYPWGGGRNVSITNITNVTNITNITNIYNYRNAHGRNGVAVVSQGDFTNGSRYQYENVHANDLHQVALAKNALPVVPTNQSLRFSTGTVAKAPMISNRFEKLPTPHTPQTFSNARSTIQTFAQHMQTPIQTTRTSTAPSNGVAQHPFITTKGTNSTIPPSKTVTSTSTTPTGVWGRFGSQGPSASAPSNAVAQHPFITTKGTNSTIPPSKTVTSTSTTPTGVWGRFGSQGPSASAPSNAVAQHPFITTKGTNSTIPPSKTVTSTSTTPTGVWGRFGSQGPVGQRTEQRGGATPVHHHQRHQ